VGARRMTTTPIAEVAGVSKARFPNPKWAAWSESFESVRNDLRLLGMKLVIHEAHLEAWNRAPVNDGTALVHRWMADNYADSMLMGLRRVVDGSRRSFSLIKLLEDIARESSLLTADRYLELWRHRHGSGDELFPRMLYGQFSSDNRRLDAARVRADIRRLRDKHAKILRFVDSVVAHRESSERSAKTPAPNLSWADLNMLFQDVTYYSLVNPGVHTDFMPVLPAGFNQAFARMVSGDAEG
jgi:hypothetical protein